MTYTSRICIDKSKSWTTLRTSRQTCETVDEPLHRQSFLMWWKRSCPTTYLYLKLSSQEFFLLLKDASFSIFNRPSFWSEDQLDKLSQVWSKCTDTLLLSPWHTLVVSAVIYSKFRKVWPKLLFECRCWHVQHTATQYRTVPAYFHPWCCLKITVSWELKFSSDLVFVIWHHTHFIYILGRYTNICTQHRWQPWWEQHTNTKRCTYQKQYNTNSYIGKDNAHPDFIGQRVQKGEDSRFGFLWFFDHDGNSQRHEGFGEINHLLTYKGDCQRSNCYVSFLLEGHKQRERVGCWFPQGPESALKRRDTHTAARQLVLRNACV